MEFNNQPEPLPAGVDVAALLAGGEQHALYAVWSTYQQRLFAQVANTSESADIIPSQALAANRHLIRLLEEWQWVVVQHARTAGDSWATIGAVLGMTEEEAANWYQRRTDDRHRHGDDQPPAAAAWFPYG